MECKRQRLEGLLAAAGLMLKTLAVDKGLLSAAGGHPGAEGGTGGLRCCMAASGLP